MPAAEDSATARHPLDPLTGAEIEAATSILKRDRDLADSARFVYVTLREPSKETVLNHQPGQIPDGEAHIVLRERAERKTYEAIVSLTTGDVKLWTELPGVQPAIMLEEFLATEEIVRRDPRWQEGLVLHLLRYEDRGTLRPVVYRASLAEMFIPYGDPNTAHYRLAGAGGGAGIAFLEQIQKCPYT